MIRYTCPQCQARLESPVSLAGEEDKCPMCGHICPVPVPRKTNRRILLTVTGIAGILIGPILVVVFVLVPGLDTPPVRPEGSSAHTPTTNPAEKADATPKGAAATNPPQDTPLSPEQLFEKASPAVVYIVVRDRNFKPIGLGSGFFVDANGLIVTNYHVIKDAEFATARLSSGATLFVDGVVATDPNADLAILKVSGTEFPCLKNAGPALPRIGSTVYAIGNPRGLKNTFSSGMVSGHREIKGGLTAIQITAPISPGSSGGPLLNTSGEVVGVTSAYLKGGQNLNFAVPVAAVRRLLQRQGKVQTLASAGGGRFGQAETEEFDKAWVAIRKEDWRGASEILIRLRKSQRDNPFVWNALGYLHFRLGNHEIAVQHWKQAMVLAPDGAVVYTIWYCLKGNDYLIRGHMVQNQKGREKKYLDALTAFRRAVAINPRDASAWHGVGRAYHYLKKHSEAIAAYKQTIVLKPHYAGAYYGMGDAYRGLKKYSQAIAAYKLALALAPKPDFLACDKYFHMGMAYYDLEKYSEAIDAYKQTINLKPDYAYAYYRMAQAYHGLEKHSEAISAWKQAMVLAPDCAEDAYYMMGLTYIIQARKGMVQDQKAREKKYLDALAAYKQVLTINPVHAGAYYGMGEAYQELEKYSEAIAAYKQTIVLKPDDANAYYNMGCSYEELGQGAAALRAFRESLRLEPTGLFAKLARDRIRTLATQ